MIDSPTAWLTAVGTIAVIGGFVCLGDKLGQEIRAFMAERADDASGDWPPSLQGDLPVLPDEAEAFHADGGKL